MRMEALLKRFGRILILSILLASVSAAHADPPLLKEDMTYSSLWTHTAQQGGAQHTRNAFSYFMPFFWGTNDLALGFTVDNNQFDFEFKKWDWLDYRFSLGFKYHSLSQFNRDAQFLNGYQVIDGAFDGGYHMLGLFTEYLLGDTTKLSGSYENLRQAFMTNGNPPPGFTLPQDNTIHVFHAQWEAASETDGDHTRYQSVVYRYAFSDMHRRFGQNLELGQFNNGHYLTGKNYDAWNRGRSQIILRETLLAAGGDSFRLGMPTLWENKFEPVMYGFSENSLLASFAFVGQLHVMNFIRTRFFHAPMGVHWYNSIALGINQIAFGTGVGIEIPFTVPFLGEYRFQSAYFLGVKDRTSSQWLVNLSSNFSM